MHAAHRMAPTKVHTRDLLALSWPPCWSTILFQIWITYINTFSAISHNNCVSIAFIADLLRSNKTWPKYHRPLILIFAYIMFLGKLNCCNMISHVVIAIKNKSDNLLVSEHTVEKLRGKSQMNDAFLWLCDIGKTEIKKSWHTKQNNLFQRKQSKQDLRVLKELISFYLLWVKIACGGGGGFLIAL